jgi:hypothetical protein
MQSKFLVVGAVALAFVACNGFSVLGGGHGKGGHAGRGGRGGAGSVDAGIGGAADAGGRGSGGRDGGGVDAGGRAGSNGGDASPDSGDPDFIPFSAPDRPCDWVDTAVQTGNPNCPNGTYDGSFNASWLPDLAKLPALAGCTRVTGDVRVPLEISGLESLRAINGGLQLDGEYTLPDGGTITNTRGGLENLRCVGHQFFLTTDIPPSNTAGLRKLVAVQGGMAFMDGITSGPPALRRVWGSVTVAVSWIPPTPRLLPAIEAVYGTFEGASAHSSDNPRLDYIGCGSTFPICKDGILGCWQNISNDAELSRLSAACNVAVGGLYIQQGESLLQGVSSLQPLQGLRGVRGQLRIVNSSRLTSLADLKELESVEGLMLYGLPNVTDLHGLEGLKTLPNVLWLAGVGVANLRALSNVHGSISTLDINGNPNLNSLEGLENVTTIHTLSIRYVPKLTSLKGLSGLKTTHSMSISRTGIRDLRGLDQLTQASKGDVELSGNEFAIFDNSKLETLDGLDALEGELDALTISNNAVLRDLRALGKVTRVKNLTIEGNPLLPDCEVKWLAERVGATNRGNAPNGGSQDCPASP